MRTFIVAVIIIFVVGALGFMSKAGFISGLSSNPASINAPVEASTTLWPHEIHKNYKAMKELPVHDVKDEAF